MAEREYPKLIYPNGEFGDYVVVHSKEEEAQYSKPAEKEVKLVR